jgi:hypothetical protein
MVPILYYLVYLIFTILGPTVPIWDQRTQFLHSIPHHLWPSEYGRYILVKDVGASLTNAYSEKKTQQFFETITGIQKMAGTNKIFLPFFRIIYQPAAYSLPNANMSIAPYFKCIFLIHKDITQYNYRRNLSIRKLILIYHYHLNLRPHSSCANCLSEQKDSGQNYTLH